MLHFKIKSFDELSAKVLYELLQLREEVFVIEQNCIYQDMDNKDYKSVHVMGFLNNNLVAYCRIVPQGISYIDYPSIGRVVTSPAVRGQEIGKKLMQCAIEETIKLYNKSIKISAQAHLQKFYQSFGFQTVSEEYLEDDIPHVAMVLSI
ncbi:MAG: GNAT family N-acetyltransferase [Chitinophagaceae bacterium]